MSKALSRSDASSSVSRSNRSMPMPRCCSLAAKSRLRGLKRPLPWANSTMPMASRGIASSPSSLTESEGMTTGCGLCTVYSLRPAAARLIEARRCAFFLFFANLRQRRFAQKQQRRSRGRVLERETNDLGGVDHSRFHEIDVSSVGCVEAPVAGVRLHFVNDYAAVHARVLGELTC